MSARLLQILLILLGCSSIIIGGAIFLLGPDVVARSCANLLSAIGIKEAYSDNLKGANIGSEMGFYSVFWVAFGFWLIKACLTPAFPIMSGKSIPLAFGIFFMGGVGRMNSLQRDGAPDPLFQVLMWIELILPILLFLLWTAANHKATQGEPQ